MLLDKTNISLNASESNKQNKRKIYVQGLLTSLTNPKVSLFFIAFLPQFIDTKASGPIPFIILGLTFTFTGLLWCLFIAYFSSYISKKIRRNQRVGMYLNKITGIIFIGMGFQRAFSNKGSSLNLNNKKLPLLEVLCKVIWSSYMQKTLQKFEGSFHILYKQYNIFIATARQLRIAQIQMNETTLNNNRDMLGMMVNLIQISLSDPNFMLRTD